MTIIPPLGTRLDTVTAVGSSSGGYMSTYMFLLDPTLIYGVGTQISGAPGLDLDFRISKDQTKPRVSPLD
jgi:hypothetical protein